MKKNCANAQPRQGAICLLGMAAFYGIIGAAFYWSLAVAM